MDQDNLLTIQGRSYLDASIYTCCEPRLISMAAGRGGVWTRLSFRKVPRHFKVWPSLKLYFGERSVELSTIIEDVYTFDHTLFHHHTAL